MRFVVILASLACVASVACIRIPKPEGAVDVAADAASLDAITYRDDLSKHPGCSTANLSYTPAHIDGYACAARDFTTTEDASKNIVLLIHGNSDTPSGWMTNVDATCSPQGAMEGAPMLAETLATQGYKVLAIDMRIDRVDDPSGNNDTENAAKNIDHGWAVPLAQHFIDSVLAAYPDRHIDVIGFSLGATVMRDALRRIDVDEGASDVWSRVDHVIALAGGNHGVSTYKLCGTNPTMRGRVTCELGDRAAYTPTDFLKPLNGPSGAWETPCGAPADGSPKSAFGRDVCGDHVVQYMTVVMQDIAEGTQQDPFVSQASSALQGADNQTVSLTDFDQSDYFFCGFFKDHYGSARSSAAMSKIVDALAH